MIRGIPSEVLKKDIIDAYKEAGNEKEFIEKLGVILETMETWKLDEYDDLKEKHKETRERIASIGLMVEDEFQGEDEFDDSN